MAELYKYENIGYREVTYKTATVGDIDVVTNDDIGKLCTLNADGQVGIDATNTTELGIAGIVKNVSADGAYATIQTGGLAEVTCGETVAYNGNRTYLGTYNGILYLASAAVATSGKSISIVEGGTTTKKAVIDLG